MGRVTKPEWGLLCLLSVWSVVPLAILLIDPSGARFTGAEGVQIGDQLQYIAWIRDAGEHVLFSNRFDVIDDPHLFLHPMWVLSGAAWQVGVSLQLAFLLWKPVAVAVLFAGFAAYARRMLGNDVSALAAGLALALFFVPPAAWIVDWAGIGSQDLRFGSLVMALELFPAGLLWGVTPTAIALGLMPLFLLGVERIVEPERRSAGRSLRWYAGWTGLAGLLASWLHPWQGLTLLAMVAGLVAWGRLDRRYLRLALPVAATAAPLAYYWALGQTDSAWGRVSEPNDMPHFGAWLFVCVASALLLALPGVGRRVVGVQERLLLLWPVAALAVYFTLQSSFFYHALAGLSLPLAVLAVRGWRLLPAPAAAAAVILFTVPGMAFVIDVFSRDAESHFLAAGEAAALDYLERDGRPGAVLTTLELGRAVPAFADRNTWVGHATWTPGSDLRAQQAEALLSGDLDRASAQRLVKQANVSYLLAGCRHPTDLRPLLGAAVSSVRRFGCATIYELDARF